MAQAISLSTEMKSKSTIFFPEEVNGEIVEFLKNNGERKQLKKGSSISKNVLLNNFIYLNDGLLFYVKRTNDYTRPKFVNAIIPKRLTDYHLLLDDNCTCCKAITVARDSEVTLVNKSLIKGLNNTNIDLFTKFMFDSNYFTERQTALAIFLLTSSAEDKLIKFLFDILASFKSDFSKDWLVIDIKLTREEIADILHISVIKLDLMIGELKKKKMIKKERAKLCVNPILFMELSPCPLGREDAKGCKSNNMAKFKVSNMISINNL
ncbi:MULTISPECIES: Crp/Fnr family transcriptional regulator [Shewanella]|uniref:Crp/Fnr family transcriptional regulator n=1 Tax=Shewanella insulae TaxID=2681496 RepID=A0A6L7HYI0_9GAMM|nr:MULTISPECIES: Crp/Fnr family transcriptional regulator [Shewanella]MCG9745966.1 Crp/Fnr family transcriptional regulator [Shewanella sp. Isolate8]MXR69346.1 Crp/Fnr family transcriptional regulator [Shewanella insulae]